MQENISKHTTKQIRGIQLGKQEAISSILEFAKQGHIDQSVADKILKKSLVYRYGDRPKKCE